MPQEEPAFVCLFGRSFVQILFERLIKTSENLVIHKSDLWQVLDHFVSFCMPAQRSIISKDPSALEANGE